MSSEKEIVFVHLLNDFSGSPRILLDTISAVEGAGRLKLFVGSGRKGILSRCKIPTIYYWYRRSKYRVFTLLTYIISQIILFLRLFFNRSISSEAIVYVNTLLPFGAALYGKLTKRRVVCHIHEISISPVPLKWFLIGIVKYTSSLNIYVSDAHFNALPITGVRSLKVYNSIDDDFLRAGCLSEYQHLNDGVFTVLLVGSLRDYKGIPEFLMLVEDMYANKCIRFELVLNDAEIIVEKYFSKIDEQLNMSVYSTVADTKPFYQRASLLVNLSRTDQWIETFGLTILEAMAFGVPVIVPPVGGPTELARDGVEGFHIDSRSRRALRDKVDYLYGNAELCLTLSQNGRLRAKCFSSKRFSNNINRAIESL